MAIYLVLSNVKLASTKGVGPHEEGITKKGTYFPDDDGKYGDLIALKAMRLVEGATTVEEAQAIIAKEIEAAKPKVNVKTAILLKQNTWGPKPDPEKTEPPKTETSENTTPPATETQTSTPASGQPIVGGGDQKPPETETPPAPQETGEDL